MDQRARQMRFHRRNDGRVRPADRDADTPLPLRAPRERAGCATAAGWRWTGRRWRQASTSVYAIGDANVIALGDGKILPKSGVFAHGEAEVVARNIAAESRAASRSGRSAARAGAS